MSVSPDAPHPLAEDAHWNLADDVDPPFAGVPMPPRPPPIPQGGATREVVLPTVSYTLGMGAQATFFFFLAPAFTRHVGAQAWDVAVFTAFCAATMAVSLFAGQLSDAWGRRPVMRAGWWAMAAAAAVLILPFAVPAVPGLHGVIAAAVLMGGGLGLSFIAYMSYVADVNRAEHERAILIAKATAAPRASALARSYGYASAGAVLASAVGPFAAAALLAAIPDAANGIAAVAGLLVAFSAVAAALTYLLPTQRPEGQPGPRSQGQWLRFLRPPRVPGDRGVWAMNVMSLILGVSYGAAAPYFAGYFLDVAGASPAQWASVLGIGTAVGAIAVLAAGLIAATERVHAATFLVGVAVFTWLPLLALPVVAGVTVAAALYVARTAFASMPGPVMNGVLMMSAEPQLRGAAMGASYFMWNFGWATGALAGGLAFLVLDAWLFPVTGAIGVIAAVIGIRLLPAAEEPTPDLVQLDPMETPLEARP